MSNENKKIILLVLCYNDYYKIKSLLNTINKEGFEIIFKLIIINNGSELKTTQNLKNIDNPKIKIFNIKKNKGFAGGFNNYLKNNIYEKSLYFLCSSDIKFSKNFFKNLKKFLKSEKNNYLLLIPKVLIFNKNIRNIISERDKHFFIIGITTEIFKRIGFLDDQNFFFFSEDDDFFKRIELNDLNITKNEKLLVFHPTNSASSNENNFLLYNRIKSKIIFFRKYKDHSKLINYFLFYITPKFFQIIFLKRKYLKIYLISIKDGFKHKIK